MMKAATDEERKKRNRVSKRKSRQRQAEQAHVKENQGQEDLQLRSAICSGELESKFSSRTTLSAAQTYQNQESIRGYSTKLVTETGGIWSSALTPSQSPPGKPVAPIHEGYGLDLQELLDSSPLERFGSVAEEPIIEPWRSADDDRQLANSRNILSPGAAGHDLEPAPQLWTRSPSDFPVQLPQEHLQRGQGHRAKREPALHRAVIMGKEDIVQLLLQNQAGVNSRDKNGCTALDLAIDLGHANIVQMLLAYGADIEGN